MTLRLVASPSEHDAQAESTPSAAESTLRELPNAAKAELRMGEAVVWWDEKNHFSWQPTALALAAGVAIFGLVSVIVPELWQDDFRTWMQPLLAVLAPSALLALREYLSRGTLILTDQAFVQLNYRGEARRLGIGDVVATKRDLLTGGVRLFGKAQSITVIPALLEAARREFAKQLRVRSTAISFHKVDDLGRFFPEPKQKALH